MGGQTARKGPIGSTNNQQGEKHSLLIVVSLYIDTKMAAAEIGAAVFS
ncbi:hypothetical protein [Cytobacillus firmus]|nr:hypothetical protein [Cytobacillus firmus]